LKRDKGALRILVSIDGRKGLRLQNCSRLASHKVTGNLFDSPDGSNVCRLKQRTGKTLDIYHKAAQISVPNRSGRRAMLRQVGRPVDSRRDRKFVTPPHPSVVSSAITWAANEFALHTGSFFNWIFDMWHSLLC
jgi:hypothetical protein